MKIRTHYDYPPIPDRSMDWSAYDADTYEPGMPVGRGRTEEAAIEDLFEQLAGDQEELRWHYEMGTMR